MSLLLIGIEVIRKSRCRYLAHYITFVKGFMLQAHNLVGVEGLEPPRLAAKHFECSESTDFTIPPCIKLTSLQFYPTLKMEEAQGFEPWVPFGTSDFKSDAIGLSATLPFNMLLL